MHCGQVRCRACKIIGAFILAGALQHPLFHREGGAAFFRDQNEFGCRHNVANWMMPAQQCLIANDNAAVCIALSLVVDGELVAL